MGTAYEAQDALGIYQTSPEDGADIYEPTNSLGGARLSAEIPALDWDFDPSYVIPPIMILYVSGANGPGTGTIRASGDSTLWYTAPGGTEGTAVTIAQGETKTLIDGTTPSKYVRVYREYSDDLSGLMYLYLVEPYGGTLGPPATTASGGNYAAVMLRNRAASNAASAIKFWLPELGTAQVSDSAQLGAAGSGTITTTGSFATWPDQGAVYVETSGGARREIAWYSSRTATSLTIPTRGLLGTSAAAGAATDTVRAIPALAIGFETPDAVGRIQEIADNTTAPTAVTFSTPVTESGALTLASLAAQVEHGLWLWVHLGDAKAAHDLEIALNAKNTIDAVTYSQTLYARYRVAGTAFWDLYAGVDAAPDFTAAAAATGSSSPLAYALTPPGSGTREYRLAVRYTDIYGLQGVNQDTTSITIDSAGAEVVADLTSPTAITLTDRAGGVVNLQATLYRGLDSPEPDYWRIYWTTDGVDPDPATDTPVAVVMRPSYSRPGAFVLDYDFATLEYATDLRVLPRSYRSSDAAESSNTTVSTISVGTALPFQPTRRHVSLGRAWGAQTATLAYDDTVTIPGTSSLAFIRHLPGESQFWAGGLNIWRCLLDLADTTGNTLFIPSGIDVVSDTVAGAGASTWYDVVSWTGGDKRIALCVASQRVAMLDISNNTLTWSGRETGATLTSHPNPTDGVWQQSTGITFHVLDSTTHTWKAFLKIDNTGFASIGVPQFVRTRS